MGRGLPSRIIIVAATESGSTNNVATTHWIAERGRFLLSLRVVIACRAGVLGIVTVSVGVTVCPSVAPRGFLIALLAPCNPAAAVGRRRMRSWLALSKWSQKFTMVWLVWSIKLHS